MVANGRKKQMKTRANIEAEIFLVVSSTLSIDILTITLALYEDLLILSDALDKLPVNKASTQYSLAFLGNIGYLDKP
jgi:hypothetical protein